MPHIAAGSSFTRRAFISAVGALGVASISQAYDRNEVLRPPGAGFDFLSKCIRCGKCVEACPYGSIQLLGIKAGVQLYSPYIDPLQTPCYLCREKQKNGDFKTYDDSLRCGKACPTGALRKIPNRVDELSRLPKELKTGVAKLNRNLCIAWQFQFCSDCYLSCPLKDKALLSRPPNEPVLGGDGIKPHVDANACMGCGQCTYVCPVRRSSGNAAPENFENKYGALVRKILARSGEPAQFPAIRVVKSIES